MSQASPATPQISKHLTELEAEGKTPVWLRAAIRHKLGLRGEVGEPIRSDQLGDEWHMTADDHQRHLAELRDHSVQEGKPKSLAVQNEPIIAAKSAQRQPEAIAEEP